MRKTTVVMLALCCCLCEAQVNDKVSQNVGSACCSDTCSVISVAQTLGAVGEKVSSMMDKITLLETKVQKTETQVLELQSLIGGKNIAYLFWMKIPPLINSAIMNLW